MDIVYRLFVTEVCLRDKQFIKLVKDFLERCKVMVRINVPCNEKV